VRAGRGAAPWRGGLAARLASRACIRGANSNPRGDRGASDPGCRGPAGRGARLDGAGRRRGTVNRGERRGREQGHRRASVPVGLPVPSVSSGVGTGPTDQVLDQPLQLTRHEGYTKLRTNNRSWVSNAPRSLVVAGRACELDSHDKRKSVDLSREHLSGYASSPTTRSSSS
jgi:hypothetical protein